MQAKTQAEYLGFRVAAALIAALPLDVAAGAMAALWRAVAPFLTRHQRAIKHLAMAFPEKSRAEREAIARAMWGHLGRTFAESFHLGESETRITLETPEIARAMRDDGPFVVCGMHMGNWELMAGYCAKHARPLAGVYQPLSNPKVDIALRDLRAPLYPLGLFPRSPATLRRLMKIAKDGGSLGFMADLREGKGAAVPFFGQPAHSNIAPALIARTFGLKLYAARILRKPDGTFSLRAAAIEMPHTGDRDADVVEATARVQAQFEAYLREAPEQWMWAHRRWD